MSGLPQVHPAGKPAHSPPDARHQSITVNHRLTVFIEQPPEFVRKLYPSAVWRMDPDERAVYLTFDDGPIPEVTPWVLDLLDKYDIASVTIPLTISEDLNTTSKIIWQIPRKPTR